MDHQNDLSLTNEFAVGSTVFEKYKILSFIASGGNGRVYRALDTLRSVDVALKVLLLESFDEKQLMRFQTEAQTASKLRHLNIATVFDFGLSDGMPYLVMEFVEGLTLDQILENDHRLDMPDFLELFIQITEAVNHAHHNGVIHRDIKPGNIVVREDPGGMKIAKILDFGVAKIINENGESGKQSGKQTPTGNIVGSPLYMSPEQARGLRVTPQSDLYSIGSMMFRCLTGRPPLQADTAIETIMRVANIPAPSLAEQPDIDVPEEVCELVDALLSKDPSLRPSLSDVVIPALLRLRDPDAFEDEGDGTAGDTTPLLTKVQHLPSAVKALLLAAVVLCVGMSVFTIWSWPESTSKNEPISLNLRATDFSNIETNGESVHKPETKKTTSLKAPNVMADHTNIDDHELELIENPEDVRTIEANADHIKTLASISRFKNLEELALGTTDITDKALEQLTKLKHLRKLNLQNTDISDAGLATISKLTELEILDLSLTPNVTSIGLRKLSPLVKLHALILNDSMFSKSDVLMFAPSINPECVIDLAGNRKISREELEQLSSKFPDLRFTEQQSVATRMVAPLSDLVVKPDRTAAENQRLLEEYQNVVNMLDKAYGKGTARSRKYYANMANIAFPIRDSKAWDRRIAWNQKAVCLSQKSGDRETELSALDSLVDCLFQYKGFAAGRTSALRAVELAKSIGQEVTHRQATRFSMLGYHAVRANQMVESEAYYKQAVAVEQNLEKDSPEVAVLLGSLGDCYLCQQNLSQAEKCFKKVNRIFKAHEPDGEGQHNANLMAYGHRAYILMLKNQFTDAMPLDEEFYRLAFKPGTKLMYAESAVNQRIDLLKKLNKSQSEIDAVIAQREKLLDKKNKHQERI